MLVVNRASALHVRKKMQYDAKTVEMTLDCPLAGCIPEDDSVAACRRKDCLHSIVTAPHAERSPS